MILRFGGSCLSEAAPAPAIRLIIVPVGSMLAVFPGAMNKMVSVAGFSVFSRKSYKHLSIDKTMIHSTGYAALTPKAPLVPFSFERRDPGPADVVIDILYCGVCHSDIHETRGDWGSGLFPMVPGHEIVGKVSVVGSAVKKFSIGESVGVGCMVDSCRSCCACKEGLEQYCEKGPVWTYDSPDPKGDGPTHGGYSNNITVDESFVLKIPPRLDLAAAAPLLCAGITTYSPLRHWKIGPGMKVGIVGLGGLGHMAIKFARSFGAHVVQFTSSPGKKEDALRLGAHEVVLLSDGPSVKAHSNSFDFILDTVSAQHDIDLLLSLLKRDSALVLVGLPDKPHAVSAFSLVGGRHRLSGSGIGGIKETQEMLEYCAKHDIMCETEMISIQDINQAYGRVLNADVKYRFVIDMSSLKRL